MATERLKWCALLRDGTWRAGFFSHGELRRSLRDGRPEDEPGDVCGFMTTANRFVTRPMARKIAIASGQLGDMWRTAEREVLSSDINWEAGKQ